MSRVSPIVGACGVGVFLGVFYTLSPLTVWVGAAMAVLLVCASRGLGSRERVWVVGLLATAVVLRLLAVAVLFLVTSPAEESSGVPSAVVKTNTTHPFHMAFPVLLPDEGYTVMRARLLRRQALGVPLSSAEYGESAASFGDTRLHEIFAYVELLVGESPYGLRFFNAALYLIASVVLYRIVRPRFGAAAALVGLALILFLPSLFVWSISTLKEPAFYFLMMITVSAAIVTLRPGSWLKRCGAFVACAVGIAAVEATRPDGAVMVGGGILIGIASLTCLRRPVAVMRGLLLCATLGVLVMQIAGAPAIEAFHKVEVRARRTLTSAALLHRGHVNTEGWHYKLLDPEFYDRDDTGNLYAPWSYSEFSYPAIGRFILRAAASFVLVPLPWQAASTPVVAYLPEQVIWYVLVALAVCGAIAGLRCDPVVTLLLAGVALVGSAGIAVTSGNIGSLVRHRGMVMVLLVWLSGLGASVLLHQFAACRTRSVPGKRERSNVPCLS